MNQTRKTTFQFSVKWSGYRSLVLLSTIWLMVQIGLYIGSGLQFGGDSGRYLNGAEALIAGQALPGKAGSYLGYVGFVAVFTKLGAGTGGIVLAQVVLSAVAAGCVYGLGARLYNRPAGFIAALLYVLYPDVQRWNFYILTESLFISVSIIATYLVARLHKDWRMLAAVPVLMWVVLIRPNGLIVPASVVVYVLYRLWRSGRHRLVTAIALAALIALPVVADKVGVMLAKENILQHYVQGTIIWGHNEISLPLSGSPPDCIKEDSNPIAGLGCFLVSRPTHMLKLALAKLWYFFAHVRPFYSELHNYFTIGTLLPIYGLLLVGLAGAPPSQRPQRILPLTICFLQMLMVVVTFADWDGRHLAVVLPFLFILFGGGVSVLLARYNILGER